MENRKIGIISQARMTSTRLPGKVLMKINGKSLLEYHLERLSRAQIPIIVATTSNKSDDVLVKLCEELRVPVFRGNEQDVLSRYYYAAKEHSLDVIVRVTSDCPLVDGDIVAKGVKEYLNAEDNLLYLSNGLNRTFPRGMDFEIFSFKMLETAFELAKTLSEREHVTPFIWKNTNNLFHLKSFLNNEDVSTYRLTVDEPADFELICKLIVEFHLEKSSVDEIVKVLRRHPDLARINASVEQKKV